MVIREYRTWTDVVKEAMRRRGFRYVDLARMAGIEDTKARYLVYHDNPRLEDVVLIAHALGLYPDELIQRRRLPEVRIDDEWGKRLAKETDLAFVYRKDHGKDPRGT